jgi:hypothetical protein
VQHEYQRVDVVLKPLGTEISPSGSIMKKFYGWREHDVKAEDQVQQDM